MGVTKRLPRPSLWIWAGVLVAVGIAVAATRSAIAAGILSAAAAVVVAIGFMLSAYADPGTWIAGVDEIFFVAAGLGVLRWGPAAARLPSALWLSLVGLAVGLSKGQVFLHALVLSAVPGTAARLLTVVAIGSGVAGGALAWRAYAK
jgi:hypothetical protein